MGVRRSREDWSRLVGSLNASGLAVGAFASKAGVNPQSLSWWRWRLGAVRSGELRMPSVAGDVAESGPGGAGRGAFIEIVRPSSAPPSPEAGVRVELGPGCRIVFSAPPTPAFLAALARAYEGVP